MDEHYLVVRESDAQEQGAGAIHVGRYPKEGMARQEADAKARARPGVRFSVYRLVDTCEANVPPAVWAARRTDTEGGEDE